MQLAPGDVLAVISDGLLDLYDTIEDFISAVRLVIAQAPTAADACSALLQLADVPEVADDVTAVILHRSRPPENPRP